MPKRRRRNRCLSGLGWITSLSCSTEVSQVVHVSNKIFRLFFWDKLLDVWFYLVLQTTEMGMDVPRKRDYHYFCRILQNDHGFYCWILIMYLLRSFLLIIG
jgi:hypothetical protein